MENIKFEFEIIDFQENVKYSFKNCNRDIMIKFTEDESILKLGLFKFYTYAVYDKVELLDEKFMIMKNSKKNRVLMYLG